MLQQDLRTWHGWLRAARTSCTRNHWLFIVCAQSLWAHINSHAADVVEPRDCVRLMYVVVCGCETMLVAVGCIVLVWLIGCQCARRIWLEGLLDRKQKTRRPLSLRHDINTSRMHIVYTFSQRSIYSNTARIIRWERVLNDGINTYYNNGEHITIDMPICLW